MATTQTDARMKVAEPKNTRRNEIIAIALFCTGLLLTLCLLSYKPNDPSWNSAGQAETRNLIGAIGANVSAALFQAVGIAAPLLPLLLFAAAWRRFRTRRIHAPLARVIGLVTLVLASAALCALFITHPLFDASVPSGGLAGELVKRVLVGGLNPVGTAILLFAIAATGLLLATNFSFVLAYEKIKGAFGNRFVFFRTLPEKFRAWQEARREKAQARVEMRQAARAEREAARAIALEMEEKLKAKTGADRVAEFMSEPLPLEQASTAATAIKRSAVVASQSASMPLNISMQEDLPPAISTQEFASTATATAATRQREVVAEQSITARGAASATQRALEKEINEAAQIEDMVKTASVVRTEGEESERNASPVAPDRATRIAKPAPVAITNYEMPVVSFLNAPPPHSEQKDEELRDLAFRVAEKCKEFNVTGKIEYICPGPVVTTYEFKPDPGVKYSRVTGLVDDLCLALKAESIRIDRVPGKAHVGIEVPNPRRETIHLREVIESRQFRESTSKLTIALGKTIDGLNYVADLAKMPHLLIAGTTGAGKSVGV
ncbi:MAG: DNA translocase FtsK 4TM domain-containing protein, partial [Pyrinomonadaceae bacterium]